MPTDNGEQAALRDFDTLATDVDLVALDAAAVQVSIDVVDRVTASDLSLPTPCADWTLAELLSHMASQHYGFAAASRGEASLDAWKAGSLGDDPASAYRAAAEHVRAAFAVDGVLERRFPMPEFGTDEPFPAGRALCFHLVDYVVHTWDVARTLGAPVEFDAGVLDAALVIAQAVPDGDMRLLPGSPFGPQVPWSGADRLDRIVALLGRSPVWPH